MSSKDIFDSSSSDSDETQPPSLDFDETQPPSQASDQIIVIPDEIETNLPSAYASTKSDLLKFDANDGSLDLGSFYRYHYSDETQPPSLSSEKIVTNTPAASSYVDPHTSDSSLDFGSNDDYKPPVIRHKRKRRRGELDTPGPSTTIPPTQSTLPAASKKPQLQRSRSWPSAATFSKSL